MSHTSSKLIELGSTAFRQPRADSHCRYIHGYQLKAEVTAPLLVSIFNPSSPLHDGAVIVQNDLIDSAACILPLTESKMVDPEMGTRHRAALGITEETDAIVILISEERSQVSIAENSHFVEIDMDDIALTKYLNDKMFISSGD